ncbi:hypothetical protein Glove_309g166 [Diversispora epigaea]|uniref:Uncharacterized protein n=1 Tax=Diversispora epigaea TaxID=1348612 RepID=A0A397HVN0_9GLOM|nr:hypothetical protein Glove_309g166 [Diversispora epigaea]
MLGYWKTLEQWITLEYWTTQILEYWNTGNTVDNSNTGIHCSAENTGQRLNVGILGILDDSETLDNTGTKNNNGILDNNGRTGNTNNT